MSNKPVQTRPGLYALFYYHLKQIAEDYGYNLVLHGSMQRDLDLIAIPWRDVFEDEQAMIDEFQEYLTGKKASRRPDGTIYYSVLPGNRHAYTIDLNRGDKHGEWVRFADQEYYLDISVIQIKTI